MTNEYRSLLFWRITAIVFLALSMFSVYVAMRTSENAIDRLGREFEYITIYEDGSYEGMTPEFKTVRGCINGRECQKNETLRIPD